MQDEEADSKWVRKLFDRFDLEEWGKNGLEKLERDDPGNLASGATGAAGAN